jgi:cobalt-zinc-cadmium efflux system protein
MNNQGKLALALLITVIIFFVELAGGFLSNSLALVSDAGHMLTDAGALLIALLATIFALRPATKERTWGFYRLEIISALWNGSVLVVMAAYIFYQAYQRFLNPAPVKTDVMLMIATIGFISNVGAAVILARESRENLNVRGAFLHVISDLVSSIGVIIGGAIILFTRWYYIDSILSVLIGLLILRGAWGLIYDSVNVLLEAVPKGIDLEEVSQTIRKIKGVKDLHDLHAWTIGSGINAVSAHIVIEDAEVERAAGVLQEIKAVLKSRYNMAHSTFQTECGACPEGLVCRIEH